MNQLAAAASSQQRSKKPPTPNRIYTESCRDVARDLLVGEALYKMSVALGVEIVPADSPGLFKHNPTPTEKYNRRHELLNQELEKDKLNERLSKGVEYAYKTTKKRTQDGRKKVHGRKSILQAMFQKNKMSASVKQKLAKLFKQRDDGEFGFS